MIGNLPKNVVNKFPTGRWGFVGSVDLRLYWIGLDGVELDYKTLRAVAEVASFGERFALKMAKRRTFATKEEALAAAEELGVEVNE